jgi:hypothetical protein
LICESRFAADWPGQDGLEEQASMNPVFRGFTSAYPPEACRSIDANGLRDAVEKELGVSVPATIVEFWKEVGSGYFGDRELYFFGDGSSQAPRDPLITWNSKDFWLEIFNVPELRPIFFAETCFGYQIGWRSEKGRSVIELFSPDTFKVFSIADDVDDLFRRVLAVRYSLAMPASLVKELGHLPDGMHFAPIVSPLVGGKQVLSNIHTETPNVHLRVSLATLKAVRESRGMPPK